MTYDREIKYMTKQLEKARLNLIYAQSHDNTPQDQIKNLVEKIKTIETILDALEIVSQVRHGRWIEQEKYTFGVMCDCSICDNRILDNGHLWNYCPNCGAKMDGDNNE